MKMSETSRAAKDMTQGCLAMAERIVRAEIAFLETLMRLGEIPRSDAERALGYFRKHRLVKTDSVGGAMSVEHGALLDRDVIRKAAALGVSS